MGFLPRSLVAIANRVDPTGDQRLSHPCKPARIHRESFERNLIPCWIFPYRANSNHLQLPMALRELPYRTASSLCKGLRPTVPAAQPSLRRHASAAAVQEVEHSSSFAQPPPSQDVVKTFDPIARSRLRRQGQKHLPASR